MSVAEAERADPLHRLTTTFGGHPCSQTVADWYLWELILNDRTDLCAIVEIGTWQGGFSRFLFAQTAMRGMDFHTFDAVVPDVPPPRFNHIDVFARSDIVERLLRSYDAPVMLLCDGGNKAREASLFTPMLPDASLLVVHDWQTEFFPDQVPEGVKEAYVEVCETLGSMSRIFEVAA